MRITTLLVSFSGAVVLSFSAGVFVGGMNHISVFAQEPKAPSPSGKSTLANVEGAIPVVVPLSFCCLSGSFKALLHKVDGVGCVGCEFEDTTFQYGGGAFRLDNSHVKGTVNIELVGAAANTAAFLNLFGLLGCPAKPNPYQYEPNKPIIKKAALENPETITAKSPYGGK